MGRWGKVEENTQSLEVGLLVAFGPVTRWRMGLGVGNQNHGPAFLPLPFAEIHLHLPDHAPGGDQHDHHREDARAIRAATIQSFIPS
jgi:hypothetical protein